MAVAMVGARAPPPSCPPGLCCSPHPPLPPSDAIPASFRAPAGLGICRLSGGASHPHGLALATVTVSSAGPVKANGPSHHTHTHAPRHPISAFSPRRVQLRPVGPARQDAAAARAAGRARPAGPSPGQRPGAPAAAREEAARDTQTARRVTRDGPPAATRRARPSPERPPPRRRPRPGRARAEGRSFGRGRWGHARRGDAG